MYNDPPSIQKWQERLDWINTQYNKAQHEYANYIVSEQACALTMDLYISFCAGAWWSVIIMSFAAIEATLRDIEFDDFTSKSAKLIESYGENVNELEWLRRMRNSLVHPKKSSDVKTDNRWLRNDNYEKDARRAIKAVFNVMFSHPGT